MGGMTMATYIVGLVLAVALFFALKHVYHNFVSGHNDCCGSESGGCGCGCADCHSASAKK
jgi:hypothetical protein